MGEIITRGADQAPALQTPEMHRLTAVLRNRLEPAGTAANGMDRSSISAPNAPTDAQRRVLKQRLNHLLPAMTPRMDDQAAVTDAILEMFYCWSDTRRMPTDKIMATAAKYTAVLGDQPLWAVRKACEAVARQDLAWPPSPGEVRAAVLKITAPVVDEAADLKRILEAEVVGDMPSEERARINNGFAILLGEIGATVDLQKAAAKPIRKRPDLPSRFDELREAPPGPLILSDVARAGFGLRPRQDEEAA